MIPSEKISFAGAGGQMLAARLHRPRGNGHGYALFAHCFACSKDSLAAARISEALASRGIGVLRFDFTGLGDSEGDFGNSGFSSNIADLVAAADFLRREIAPPWLLVGHSLGGAAVLAASPAIPDARAIATINAPSDPAHVLNLFNERLEEVDAHGVAEVQLGGRSFSITRNFVTDIRQQRLLEIVRDMGKALLVFHAPQDPFVGIDNASTLFRAARHPKSFVSLDGADHLLSRRQDAVYAADVIAAWASRCGIL
jgi:Predicted hydrolase of the alpha/beta superfamily